MHNNDTELEFAMSVIFLEKTIFCFHFIVLISTQNIDNL